MTAPRSGPGSLAADLPPPAWPDELCAEIGKRVVGQRTLVEGLLVGLLCRGHVLIEGVPGLAKTLTVKTLSQALDLDFRRIQFTPDLLPSDLLGTPVFDPGRATFRTRRGPVFANLLLADEINRAPAKVQSALLEAMEEGQVTIGDESLALPSPFFVLATQNPLEHEGTYPLPEAQLDRFLLRLPVSYPSREEEARILDTVEEAPGRPVRPVLSASQLRDAIESVRTLHLAAEVRDYILDLVNATRQPAACGLSDLAPYIACGVSPRGSIFLARAARALAFLRRRRYVVPDDVLEVLPLVLGHRLFLTFQADADGVGAGEILERIRLAVPPP